MSARRFLVAPVRLMAFSLLSLVRPAVIFLLEAVAMLSMLGFIGCAIFREWGIFAALLGSGLVCTALMWSYDALLAKLVPFNYGFLSEG